MGRFRLGIRQASTKVVVGIAAAALAGGAAIGAVAVAASNSSTPAAQSASYGWSVHSPSHQQLALTAAVSNWKKAQQTRRTALATALAKLAMTQTFATVRVGGTIVAAQAGVELTATPDFLVVQSMDGTVNVWVLSHATIFQNVTNSTKGTRVWNGTKALAKGDMIFVEGTEHHGDLFAAEVMFSTKTTTTPTTPPTTGMPTGTGTPTAPATGTGTPTAPATGMGTPTTPPTTGMPTKTMTPPTTPPATTSASAPPTFGGPNS